MATSWIVLWNHPVPPHLLPTQYLMASFTTTCLGLMQSPVLTWNVIGKTLRFVWIRWTCLSRSSIDWYVKVSQLLVFFLLSTKLRHFGYTLFSAYYYRWCLMMLIFLTFYAIIIRSCKCRNLSKCEPHQSTQNINFTPMEVEPTSSSALAQCSNYWTTKANQSFR